MLTVPMEGRCARPWEKQRHHTSMSHHEAKGEDPGWGIRKRVEQELGEGQQRFRKGRGTVGCLR